MLDKNEYIKRFYHFLNKMLPSSLKSAHLLIWLEYLTLEIGCLRNAVCPRQEFHFTL